MAKKSKFDFSHVEDAALRDKLERTVAEHDPAVPPEVNAHPRYVFGRATPHRDVGGSVIVRNGLDEDRAGTLLGPLGRAWRVDVNGTVLIVHDPEDSWG